MTLALLLLALTPPHAAVDTVPMQPRIDYAIEATLDETTDILTGRARLVYVNRSGVALDTLWFHQHLNAFRPNSAWARRELEYREDRFQRLGRRAREEAGAVAIQAEQDEVVPAELGQALFDRYAGPKRLWIQRARVHNNLDYHPLAPWWGEVREFLLSAER